MTICSVCNVPYEAANNSVHERRMQQTLREGAGARWSGLCPTHALMRQKGFIALVGAVESPAGLRPTGNYTHILPQQWHAMFPGAEEPEFGALHVADSIVEEAGIVRRVANYA